ncbi:hypothetical protein H1R20_g12407, partial [Candolleomyces eurysporus]
MADTPTITSSPKHLLIDADKRPHIQYLHQHHHNQHHHSYVAFINVNHHRGADDFDY